MDPIEYFPYEIFTKIIGFAAYGVSNGPLPFLTTSNRWMTTIMNTPEAWTYIRVDNDPEVHQRTLTFLELSRGRPIDIHISWRLCYTEALNIILTEYQRIRVIYVKDTDAKGDLLAYYEEIRTSLIDFFEKNLTKGFIFPHLEEIVFERHERVSKKLLAASPNLWRLNGALMWPLADYFPYISGSVKDLEFRTYEGADLNILSNPNHMFKLTSLRLTASRHYYREGHDDEFSPLFLETNRGSLENFHITNSLLGNLLGKFLQYPPIRLHSLTMDVPVNMMHYFASSISLFPELQSMSVSCIPRFSSAQDDKSPASPPSLVRSHSRPLLRYFSLVDAVNELDHSHLTNVANHLVTHLLLRGVHKMELNLRRSSFIHILKLAPLLRAASNLRVLTLDLLFYREMKSDLDKIDLQSMLVDPGNHVTLENLETLRIKSVDYLRFIHTPNLVDLRVDKIDRMAIHHEMLILGEKFGRRLNRLETHWRAFEKMLEQSDMMREGMNQRSVGRSDVDAKDDDVDNEDEDRKDREDELVYEGWINVQEIIWKKWKTPCILFTARLRSITFIHLPQGSYTATNNYMTDPINSLCYLLWKNEDACPCLNTISSMMFPFWDLLFLTIRSRIRPRSSPSDLATNTQTVSSNLDKRAMEFSKGVTEGGGTARKPPTVSSITTLQLPFLPITPLLRRLVDLLGGRSRDDIIGAGSAILQRMTNKKFYSNCTGCLSAGYTSCLTVECRPPEPDQELEGFDWKELIRLLDLESAFSSLLPNDNWESLEKLLEGERPGYEVHYSLCGLRYYSQLLTIDGFTPIGKDAYN